MPLADIIYPSDKAFIASLDQVQREQFEKWLADLNRENASRGHPLGHGLLEVEPGAECWFACFEDGMSAADTIDEECEYQ